MNNGWHSQEFGHRFGGRTEEHPSYKCNPIDSKEVEDDIKYFSVSGETPVYAHFVKLFNTPGNNPHFYVTLSDKRMLQDNCWPSRSPAVEVKVLLEESKASEMYHAVQTVSQYNQLLEELVKKSD